MTFTYEQLHQLVPVDDLAFLMYSSGLKQIEEITPQHLQEWLEVSKEELNARLNRLQDGSKPHRLDHSQPENPPYMRDDPEEIIILDDDFDDFPGEFDFAWY